MTTEQQIEILYRAVDALIDVMDEVQTSTRNYEPVITHLRHEIDVLESD